MRKRTMQIPWEEFVATAMKNINDTAGWEEASNPRFMFDDGYYSPREITELPAFVEVTLK